MCKSYGQPESDKGPSYLGYDEMVNGFDGKSWVLPTEAFY